MAHVCVFRVTEQIGGQEYMKKRKKTGPLPIDAEKQVVTLTLHGDSLIRLRRCSRKSQANWKKGPRQMYLTT